MRGDREQRLIAFPEGVAFAGHDDVWLTTSDDIADWYFEHYYDEAIGRAPAVPPR